MTVTDDEALRLVPGDVLLASVSEHVERVEVVDVHDRRTREGIRWFVQVWVRRHGTNARGKPFPTIYRQPKDLHRLPRPDAPAFHVAADWLDEHDEPMAAAKLRRAFPLNGAG
jgi:hypothetical protein